MKVILILLAFVASQCAPKPEINKNEILLNTQSKVIIANNYEMIISQIKGDSRCPIGVDCIWAGQVELIIKVFKENEEIATQEVVVGPRDQEITNAWFAKYTPSDKKIQSITVFPARDNNKELKFEEYELKIILE